MKDRKDDENWAGKGFNRRNEESAPDPKPKLRVVPKSKSKPDKTDDDEWIWE